MIAIDRFHYFCGTVKNDDSLAFIGQVKRQACPKITAPDDKDFIFFRAT
jgi:hypothetical protein